MRNRNSNTGSLFSNSITFYRKMNTQLLALTDKENKKSSEENVIRSYQAVIQQVIHFLLESGFSPMQLMGSVGVDKQTRAYFVKQCEGLFYNAIYFNRQLELQAAKLNYVENKKTDILKLGRQVDRAKQQARCVKKSLAPFTLIAPTVVSAMFLMMYLIDKYMPDHGREVNATSEEQRQITALAETAAILCAIGITLTAAICVGVRCRMHQAEVKLARAAGPGQANLDAFNAAFDEIGILDRLSEDQTMHERQFNRLICGELLLKNAMNGVGFVEDANPPAADVEAPQAREMDEYSSLIANRR